jgi:acetyl esterase
MLAVALYFHGGGWYFSSVDTHDRVAREIAAAGEMAVVSVDYALSPEAKFPQAVEECAAVVRHLAAHAAEWQIDPSRIVVSGDSAGGNLALATGLLLRDSGAPKLRGILAAYPVCDSDFTTPSYHEFATGLPLTAEKMRFFWNAYVFPCNRHDAPIGGSASSRSKGAAASAVAGRGNRRTTVGMRGARPQAARCGC